MRDFTLKAVVSEKGYFTKLNSVRGCDGAELEKRLGFRSGRMKQGWWLLLMTEMPTASDFAFRGYSYMSGGVVAGHLPCPPDPRNAEQRLLDEHYDVPRLKRNIIRDTFRVEGYDRLCKVVPCADAFGSDDYPMGSGVPQWELTSPKKFLVEALIPVPGRYV